MLAKEISTVNRQRGFTLVEIAVVLVIIGLLLGGVLKGQELITQAKIKNVANDFNGLAAAIYSYQDRYRALPGDDKSAASRWTSTGIKAGDGNGLVGGSTGSDGAATQSYSSTTTGQETRQFWQHLRNAGFIAGDVASEDQPLNAAGGMVGVQTGALGLQGLVICSANLPAKVANAIDAQFDDGNAAKGSVRAHLQEGSNDAVGSSADEDNYVDNGSNLYVVCKNI